MKPILIPLNATEEQRAAARAEVSLALQAKRAEARENAHTCLARARRSRNQGRPIIARIWLHNARWWRRLSNYP